MEEAGQRKNERLKPPLLTRCLNGREREQAGWLAGWRAGGRTGVSGDLFVSTKDHVEPVVRRSTSKHLQETLHIWRRENIIL